MKLLYPLARRSATQYVLHGRTIPEPYDWLESPDDAETVAFVAAQNAAFRAAFSPEAPLRTNLQRAISKTFYPRTSAPFPHGGKYYYFHNKGLENQSRYLRADDPQGSNEELFLDPNALSEDGTTSIRTAAWSKGDRYYAYALSEKGSDWSHILLKQVAPDGTISELPDRVEWVKYSSIAWLGDDGFFYVRYPPLTEGQEKGAETSVAVDGAIYFHRIGTPQSEDVKVLAIPDQPCWLPQPVVSDCKRYLIVTVSDGCEPKNLVWIAALPEKYAENPASYDALRFNKIINDWVGEYSFIGNDAEDFYFKTTAAAPNGKLVLLNYPSGSSRDIVPERTSVLSSADICMSTFLLIYTEDVKDVLYSCTVADGTLNHIDLPLGSITSLSCRRELSFVSLKVVSFTLPGRSYTMNIETLNPVPLRDDKVEGLVPADYVTKQVFVPAADANVKIPMFIIHHKDIDLTRPNPTLLYGYGGFNISLTPGFSPTRMVYLRHLRGIYAIANIRGGGEYGEKWHDAGRRANKMNCFKDFIGCAKYLNAQSYCDPRHLAIMGGSNGGLLTAACTNIAPEQFGAVVAQVGVLDMFKFHKFTIGHAWRSDYGDPDVKEDFEKLEEYSPLHNISPDRVYPPVLVVTGDHDDRVVPLHSLKYIASLQHTANPEGGPFYARIEVSAGHGAGKPTSKVIEESADIYHFIAERTGAKWWD